VEVVIRIVSKDLRCGVNVKTWAKYIKDIPNYQVMCCERDLERFIQKECKGNLKNIYKSQKLDGVRCSCNIDLIENRIISHLSRNGKEYPNFDVFDEELFKIAQVLKEDYRVRGKRYIQVDGEATAVGKNKEEVKSFQKLMTQIRRLNSIDKNLFRFHIFDVVLEKIIFKDRYEILEKINTNELTKDNKIVTLLIHDDLPEFIRNADDIREYTKYLTDQYGWEGLVLKNKYSYYELKRSHQWCKVKWMISRDVEVIGWEKGEPRGKYNSVLGKLICVYPDNGKKFGVGSGFSDEQRIEFMTDTPKLIEIEFQELTEEEVPRFPSFTRVREDKDEPN
jgi:DNA ligase-1